METEKIRDVFPATGSKMGAKNMIQIDAEICTLKNMKFNEQLTKFPSKIITDIRCIPNSIFRK